MSSNVSDSASQEALKRLNPATEKVYAVCSQKVNRDAATNLKTYWEVANKLNDVSQDTDTYGSNGLQDLAISLKIGTRKRERYISVARTITEPEFEAYSTTLSDSGSQFTFTHLVALASLKKGARTRAFAAWTKSSATTKEFEDLVQSLVDQTKDASEPAEPAKAEITPVRRVKAAAKVLDKANLATSVLQEVDFAALLLSGDDATVEAIDALRVSLMDAATESNRVVARIMEAQQSIRSVVQDLDDLPEPSFEASPEPYRAPKRVAPGAGAAATKPAAKKAPGKKTTAKKAAKKADDKPPARRSELGGLTSATKGAATGPARSRRRGAVAAAE